MRDLNDNQRMSIYYTDDTMVLHRSNSKHKREQEWPKINWCSGTSCCWQHTSGTWLFFAIGHTLDDILILVAVFWIIIQETFTIYIFASLIHQKLNIPGNLSIFASVNKNIYRGQGRILKTRDSLARLDGLINNKSGIWYSSIYEYSPNIWS